MRRGITMAVLSLAAAAAAAQDDPFGRYPEPVTLRIGMKIQPTGKLPPGDAVDSNQFTRMLADKLNLKTSVVWAAAEGKDYDQRVNLSIAADDLPDGLVVNTSQLLQMVKAGELADLTDAYRRYASPAMKAMLGQSGGKALEGVTFEGKILALPSLAVPEDGYHLTWIRQDWLDRLGLAVPRTVADLEAVARAFVERDPGRNGPGRTIGIAGPQSGGKLYSHFLDSTNNSFGFDPLFSAYRAYPGYWLRGRDGKAVYGSILPETRAALAKLAGLYRQGLLDPEVGVRKDATEPVIRGLAGLYFGNWWNGYWPLADAMKQDPNANWQAFAIPLDGGGRFRPHAGALSNFYTVVRRGYSHPEAVVKMLNLLIRDEGTFDLAKADPVWFPLRVPMALADETPVTLKALRTVLSSPSQRTVYQGRPYSGYKLLSADVVKVGQAVRSPFDRRDRRSWNLADEYWPRAFSYLVGAAALYDQPIEPVSSVIYHKTATMETRWDSLKRLEDETFLKILLGKAPLEAFDQFVAQWKAQGGDAITREVDQASR